jgi:hypothetical protein
MSYTANLTSAGSVDNLRVTLEQIVKNLGTNLTLGVSGGLDSQILIHSFASQGIPFNAATLYMQGYNDGDLENLKVLEQKYNFKLTVIELDIHSRFGQDILSEYYETGVLPEYILYKHFVSKLPTECNFVQGLSAPVVLKRNVSGKHKLFYVDSKHHPHRELNCALSALSREGKIININDDPRYISSILHDPAYCAMLHSYDYLRGNRILKNKFELADAELYHYFARPIMYSKYWDNLIYSPKIDFVGNIDWPHGKYDYTSNTCYIDYNIYKKFLEKDNATLSLPDNSNKLLS